MNKIFWSFPEITHKMWEKILNHARTDIPDGGQTTDRVAQNSKDNNDGDGMRDNSESVVGSI